MNKRLKKAITAAVLLLGIVGCTDKQAEQESAAGKETIKIGIYGDKSETWQSIEEQLNKEGIDLEFVTFSDYNNPNIALNEGTLDVNAYQHKIFLDDFNEEYGTDLVPIGYTTFGQLGLYSRNVKDLKDYKKGDKIAISADITNGGRGLLLLQSAGLIKVNPDKGLKPQVADIIENPIGLEIIELDAGQIVRSLADVDGGIIMSGSAIDAGFDPHNDPLFIEPISDNLEQYVGRIVTRREDKDNPVLNKIVDAYQTDETKQLLEEKFKGTVKPAWEIFGRD